MRARARTLREVGTACVANLCIRAAHGRGIADGDAGRILPAQVEGVVVENVAARARRAKSEAHAHTVDAGAANASRDLVAGLSNVGEGDAAPPNARKAARAFGGTAGFVARAYALAVTRHTPRA